MPKNIVICCDGTGEEFGDHNSNVVKLYSTLIIDGKQQVGYYHAGVGTMGAPAARNKISAAWSIMMGLAFGAGLLANVGDAYRYLMNVFENGDRVFLFGFSRGAYTARALAGVLHMFGLLCPGNEGLIPYIIRLYAKRTRNAAHRSFGRSKPNSEVRQADTFGVLKLTLHPTSYDWEFVPEAGKAFTDTGTGTCH